MHSFITFDVVDFYPSISEQLLRDALEFASQFDDISEEEKAIIIQAKRSLLFSNETAWCRKASKSLFDVTMGSFDGAETCELVGSFLLSKLSPECQNNIGLYRDDGLAAFDKTPRDIENVKKEICKTFSEHNLKITIQANKKSVNYLDITLDLRSGTYKPFNKPGNTPQYVNRHSSHPPSILRSIPESINRRLSNISSDKQSFDAAIPIYQEALEKSGYDYKLHYNPQPAKPKQHQRNRNVVWFNPPYSTNVATNVGKRFLAIITECFPPNHILHKILNRNTLKLSYSCMPNIGNIISAHNQSVLAKKPQQISVPKDKNCNCRQKDDCPLSQKCLVESVVYQATVTRDDNNDQQTYVGLTAGDFKTRYNNHTSSFRNPKHKNSTVLSKYIWTLKDSKILYSIKWKILRKCKPYSSRTKRCNLCLHEKYIIICYPELSSLNSRNELISTCPHRKKHLLCNQ
jgi:hypothetical protein